MSLLLLGLAGRPADASHPRAAHRRAARAQAGVDPLHRRAMAAWMPAFQRNGFGFTWPYQGDPGRLRVDLPPRESGGTPMNVTRARASTRRLHDAFSQARGEAGMWENWNACTVIAYLHGVEAASLPDRPHPGQSSLYAAALDTIADYMAARGEASAADVRAGRYFRPAAPRRPSDLESRTYLDDWKLDLDPPRVGRSRASYRVFFSRGPSGLYQAVRVLRFLGDPDQRVEELPVRHP